jgi:hypothetical protein
MTTLQPIKSLLPTLACGMLGITLCAAAVSSTGRIVKQAPLRQTMPADLNRALEDARYRFAPAASGGLRADNDANAFSARFSGPETAVTVRSREGRAEHITLALASYGWGSSMRPAGPVTQMLASGKRLNRQYGPQLSEWFENAPQGLEQGFAIAHRATAPNSGSLRLKLQIAGGWSVRQLAGSVRLISQNLTLEYTALKVWDATGAVLPSHPEVSGAGIEIQVDDARAVYPITIDPLLRNLTQQQELTAVDAAAGDQFGWSVALSNDGNTALIGANAKNNHVGAAYVFLRSGSGWALQQELTESNPGTFDLFGSSVALSSDGNTALIGAYIKNNLKGAASVFVRSGNVWTQQQELTASDAASGDNFGFSAALSSDGNTAILGAPVKNAAKGAAYVFTRSADIWTEQQKLTALGAENNDQFGISAALSSDGNTALLGAFLKNSAQGAAYIFTGPAGSWTQQQELTASDAAPNDQFGRSVAISGDGATALAGALNKAYAFTTSPTGWTQNSLTPSDGAHGYYGWSVAISMDGSTSLVGAYMLNSHQGAAYVFDRSAETWNQRQKLTPLDAADNDQFGYSLALSADGSTALVGADGKTNTGAAYAFAADSIAPTATSSQLPLPNDAGWNTTDVLVSWNWTDNPGGSGIDFAQCATASASSGEGAFPVSAACNDLAGNVGSASHPLKVDKTNPTVTASARKADNTVFTAGGWANQTVTVSFTCADAISGIATCPAAQVFPVSAASATGTAFDVAGNSSTIAFGPIQIEKVPPTISAAASSAPNANGWYNAGVTVHFTCLDSDSGIPAGTCPSDQILSAEGAAVSSTAMTVMDAAGNTSSPGNVVTVQIDKTAPSIVWTGNSKTYGVDQTVAIACTATDALSGVASNTCANINGAAYAIGTGSHTYSAGATDRAGNTGNGSTSFTIAVTFTGVINLVNRWVTDSDIAAKMVASLQGAQTAFAGGSITSGDNQLNAFTKQVSSQSGKTLTAAQASLLLQYAKALMQ